MAEEIEPRRSRKNSANHQKKQQKQRLLIGGLIIVLIIGIISYQRVFNNIAPVNEASQEQKIITIPSGTSTRTIASLLEQEGLIRSQTSFNHYVRKNDYDSKLRSGDYVLSPSMSVEQIVEELLTGIGETLRFTIPEGYTLKDIAAVLVKQDIMDEDTFWQTIAQIDISPYPYIQDVPDDEHRLEGYLFPDTYIIALGASPEAVIQTMLKRFDDIYHSLPENVSGLNAKELVILASLIEAEARLDEERPLIASVYLNRLRDGMLLQCDATVLYGMPERKERLYYSDYKHQSPYNTYLIKGFPPTPICNPGQQSLIAACQPAETSYYYYLWNKESNGAHVFATTYAEHQQNRKKYGYN